MWRWDQGHLPYFQFDALRKIAGMVVERDFKELSRSELARQTGLSFAGPATHSPWRQYSRALRLSLLVSEENGRAVPTAMARLLASAGVVTCDEYLHFLVESFTDPSPAFENWHPDARLRFPLLFGLKYLLAKRALKAEETSSLDEIIGAYMASEFAGDEVQDDFIHLLRNSNQFADLRPGGDFRQPRESLQVISQISYFLLDRTGIRISLDAEDASEIFNSLHAVSGARSATRDEEISRLAELFRDGSTQDFFGYANTVVSEVVESGFLEGSKVKRTHVVIERNRELRKAFFASMTSAVCDLCALETLKTYPWTNGTLDLHHLLPLASGARVVNVRSQGTYTTLDDLVAVCPSCHRAIHRFYDLWLAEQRQRDFADVEQAKGVYRLVRESFGGAVHV